MLASAALITTMVVGIRHLAQGLHPFEIAFFRNLFGLAALAPLILRHGWRPLQTTKIGLLTVRGVLNGISLLLFFLAVTLVPVARIAAFSFTTPLFVTVLAVMLLGERLGGVRLAGLLVGFAGALIILQPGVEAINIGAIYALGSAAVWAAALIVTKILSRTEQSVTITFYGVLTLIPMTLIPALFVWEGPNVTELLWLAGLGAIWISGQLCMTQALKLADASLVMPFDFSKLIWGSIAGFIFFAEIPSVWTWIGASLVLGATSYVALRDRQPSAAPAG